MRTVTLLDSSPRVERLPTVMARTGLSRASIYRGIAAGTFVQPVRLTGRSIGFLAAEIDAWIANRGRTRANKVGVSAK